MRVALQVAERARLRRREGRRVEEQQPAVLDEGIDAGNEVRTARAARRAAAGRVDDGRAVRRRRC